MAESITVKPTKKYRHKTNKKVRSIKMKLLPDFSKESTNTQVEQDEQEAYYYASSQQAVA